MNSTVTAPRITGPGWYRMRNGSTVWIDGIENGEAWSWWHPRALWNAHTGKHNHSVFDIVRKVHRPMSNNPPTRRLRVTCTEVYYMEFDVTDDVTDEEAIEMMQSYDSRAYGTYDPEWDVEELDTEDDTEEEPA
jgi:hypothetical protein